MSTGPGLRARKKQQTRQAIQAAAMRLFGARGFDDVTVAEIADAANVSVPTLFNYFPTKEDLVYSGMEAFEANLLEAIRGRAPRESVLSAFRRFVLQLGGLLASSDVEATERLAQVSRIITDSPTLLARENQIIAHYTRSLATLLAEETDASPNDLQPWVAATALMGVHRALLDLVRKSVVANPRRSPRLARVVREQGEAALALLDQGLGDYAVKPNG